MSIRNRWIVVALGAVIVTSASAGAPAVLRRLDSFSVQKVEVRGTRYMTPYDALVQSGITRKSTVFDDFEPWRARLLEHPIILDASIERRLPRTIRVSITETEPIALARTPDLTPVDARAKALPIDPSRIDLDVPVLSMQSRPNAHGVFADVKTQAAVDVLALLRQDDPRLYSWISEAGPVHDHGIRLALRKPLGAETLVSADPRALRLDELQVVLADLSARGELSNLKRMDARFHDQIVVTLK